MNRTELIKALEASINECSQELFVFAAQALHPAESAAALESSARSRPEGVAEAARLVRALPRCARAQIFSFLAQDVQPEFFRALGGEAGSELIEDMSSDDAVDLLGMLQADEAEEACSRLDPELSGLLKELSSYPDGTCGSETSSGFAALKASDAVRDAVEKARECAGRVDTINVLYVLDDDGRLQGTLSLRTLLTSDPQARVSDVMTKDPIFVDAAAQTRDAVDLIRRYDLLAVPVAAGSGRMIGIITVDDALDAGIEEDAADLARFGGSAALSSKDIDLRSSSFREMFGVRVFWLVVLTLFGMATSTFVAAQQEMLEQAIVLAAFIAPIVDMGGNAGSQSATLVLRGMALGSLTLSWRDVWFVVKREMPVAACLGAAVAVLEAILAGFGKGVGGDVLLVVAFAMALCTMLGGVVGALLPFLAKRIGADPATLSSPLITSIMDLVGVFIYFALAYCLLAEELGI